MKEGIGENCSTDSQHEVVERVKARLQEEGREARNLIAYSLPLQDPTPSDNVVRHREIKRVADMAPRRGSKSEKRPRSASAGRDPKMCLRARHWGFLFRNLQQAVDEIYQTCEDDESVVECKEAILILERYTSDFKKLIEWLKVKWEYEHTPPPQRPNSVSWEIRTSSSPGKVLNQEKKMLTLSEARRALNFDLKPERHGAVNGSLSVMERKVNEKYQGGKMHYDGTKDLKVSTSPKPTIVVHQASIEEQQEEGVTKSKTLMISEETDAIAKLSDGSNTVIKETSQTITNSNDVEEMYENKECVLDGKKGIQVKEFVAESVSEECDSNVKQGNFGPSNVSTEISGIAVNTEKVAVDLQSILSLHSSVDSSIVSIDEKESLNESESVMNLGDMAVECVSEKGMISKEDKTVEYVGEKGKVNKERKAIKSFDEKSKVNKEEKPIEPICEKGKGNEEEKAVESVNEKFVNMELPDSPKGKDSKFQNNASTKLRDKSTSKIQESLQKENETKICEGKLVETADTKRSCAEVVQGRSSVSKPGPTVNMNKASQVRQAFNQNKTPQKYPRCMNVNSRQPTPRISDIKPNITKQQGSGGKIAVRRVWESKSANSPPLGRKSIGDIRTGCGGSRYSAPNVFTRSYTTLSSSGKGLMRAHTTLTDSCMAKHHGSNSYINQNGLNIQERTTSSSSLSSSTSSSGLSWADKVRGVPVSLQSSQLSLQDDGEGWEIVRRGRRSHGGSTASLNNSNYSQQLSHSNKDSRSGSLKNDGHEGRGMKNRFHMPSAAMSVPSLAVSNSVSSETENQNNNRGNTNNQRSNSASKKYSGKKAKSQSNVISCTDDTSCEKRKSCSSGISSNSVNKKGDNKRNKGTSKSTEELSKVQGKRKENNYQNSDDICKREKSECCNDEKEDNENSQSNYSLEISSNSFLEYSDSSETSDDRREKYSNTVNYLCDPSIPETSETSDAEDLEKGKNSVSKKSFLDSEIDLQESLLFHGERDSRNYDSDSAMDEDEMFNIAALESAIQEEQRLKKQIEETEKEEIKVDDVDCEEDGSDVSEAAVGRATSPLTPPYDSLLASLSWADQVDMMESLEELRHPGRLLHIHEKLSSPSRKRSLSEKMKRYEDKLAKAQELREKLIQAKTDKLKDLFKKIEEVRVDKELLLDEKRELFHRKMKRAEEKRRRYLQEIVNKAHDEEKKTREIAFINGLEAQNKLHDMMQQHQSLESRLADMAEERTRRQEEKAAKEVAAQERRKALEAERQARMAELCEKRRRKCERIDRKQAERREELLEQAREKARDREERLSALQQAQQAKETELVKKIQQKQEESARRHEESIKQIRQKALESSIMKYSRGCDDAPRLVRYETKKLCTLCNSLITSEVYLLSHLRGPRHQEELKVLHQAEQLSLEDSETYNLKHIIDAPANIDDPQVTRDRERQKALKRRCKKIRTRMTTRGKEFNNSFKPTPLKDSPNKSRMNKALQQIAKLVANQGSGPWPVSDLAALDKPLLELLRILEKKEKLDQLMFTVFDGFSKIDSVLKVISDSTEQRQCVLPPKSLGYCGRVILGACQNNVENCEMLLYSNMAGKLIDYLMHRLNELAIETTRLGSDSSINTIVSLPSDAASGAIFKVLAEVMEVLHEGHIKPGMSALDQAKKDKADATWIRLQDFVSYCVSVGLADKISWYFSYIQGPLDNDPGVVEVTLSAMDMVASLAKILNLRSVPDDPTQLIGTLHVTDACGVVSLLYGILLHQGGRSALPTPPPKLSQTTQALTIAATTLLHNLASLNLIMFQGVLGSEGISLELRHIASYLLWYCSYWPCEEILHNVIALVGFYAVNNKENQMVIQSGEVPSVLQQLCNLPWQYFSEPRLTAVLFPTLLACCLDNPDNMVILQQEMSFQVLEDFLHNGQATDKPLVTILQRTHVQG